MSKKNQLNISFANDEKDIQLYLWVADKYKPAAYIKNLLYAEMQREIKEIIEGDNK